MNIFKRAWLWLITKKESEVSEPITDTTVVTTDPAAVTTVTEGSATATPAAEIKSGVQDFEAALAFVESGVAQLGAAAKDDLKALAKKYL
ncbi:hypothetical protein [Pantoea vagans]|uniref:hypothetical protein n=1 Tax=Pantoea vagans TaxID=470934 RepID=UPI00076B2C3D|nr:hypothetical protein [Pantoea vagans]AMG57746.1 hypothetical protein AL522_08905 [Pantoea vagans]